MASDKKTLKQLLAQQNEINAAIESARTAEIEGVKKLITDKAAEFGYHDVVEFIGFLGYRVVKAKKTKQLRVRLSDIQKEEIRAKFKAGAKVPDIRKEYGVSYGTANSLRKEVKT
jgi:hypothetical protein